MGGQQWLLTHAQTVVKAHSSLGDGPAQAWHACAARGELGGEAAGLDFNNWPSCECAWGATGGYQEQGFTRFLRT